MGWLLTLACIAGGVIGIAVLVIALASMLFIELVKDVFKR